MTTSRRDLATLRLASSGFAVAILSTFALARSPEEKKAPTTFRNTLPVKATPLLPPKDPATRRAPSSNAPARDPQRTKGNLPAVLSHAQLRIDTSRVHFDTPGDGTIWALGAGYKASFGPDRAQFIPFLGSSAPQDYPVALALQDVEVGGQAVEFTRGVPAQRTGDTIVFDRGSLLETYQLTPGGMEQSFVFDSLPVRGELVVRSTADTELEGLETADGLRFSNELGYVSYSRAVAYDATGRSTPAATHLDGGSIEIRVPAEFVAGATLPLTVDPVVNTFGVDTSSADTFSPDVAFDSVDGVYAVVWELAYSSIDHDVYFKEFDTVGNPINASSEAVDLTTDFWAHPRIACDAAYRAFLIVAAVGPISSRNIMGRITNGFAPYTEGSQFQVSNGTAALDNFNPDVGGDPTLLTPTYFMVTWEGEFHATDHDIYAQLVDFTGTLQGAIPIAVDFTPYDDEYPSISKSDGQTPYWSQRWTIAWQRKYNATDHDIWANSYTYFGVQVPAGSYIIDSTANDDYFPSVSSPLDDPVNTREYLVAYQEVAGPSTHDIVASIYNETTLLASGDISASEGQGFQVQDQIHPAADSDGTNYAIAYSEQFNGNATDYDTYMCTAVRNGINIVVPQRHANLDFSTTHADNPRITSTYSGGGGKARYMTVWESTTNAGSDIMGGLYDKNSMTSYCFPSPGNYWDAAIACPCGNPPSSAGRGCDNSAATGGAMLTSSGEASLSADTVQFTSSGEKPTAFSLFAQGTSPVFAGAVFGMGVRCVGGSLKRLYNHAASGGVVSGGFGVGSDSPVHVRSAALGDVITVGSARFYFVYYRDPNVPAGCPAGSTFNCTQSGSLIWYP